MTCHFLALPNSIVTACCDLSCRKRCSVPGNSHCRQHRRSLSSGGRYWYLCRPLTCACFSRDTISALLQGGCAHSPHSLSPIRHDTAPHQLTTLVEPTFVSPSFRQNCITTHTYNTQEQYSYPKTQLPSLHQGRENNQPTDSPISYVFATKTKTKTNNDDNGDSNFNAATLQRQQQRRRRTTDDGRHRSSKFVGEQTNKPPNSNDLHCPPIIIFPFIDTFQPFFITHYISLFRTSCNSSPSPSPSPIPTSALRAEHGLYWGA